MPRIGFTPWDLHASYISTAPFITPWSVRPRAGMPSSAARAAIRSILQAPSSSEYSLWTWRWTACEADCEGMPGQSYAAGRSAPPPLSRRTSQLADSASVPSPKARGLDPASMVCRGLGVNPGPTEALAGEGFDPGGLAAGRGEALM